MTVQLERVLAAHVGRFGRFVDTPPDTVEAALATLDPEFARLRSNGQPPATWLIEQARKHGGLLGGSFSTEVWIGMRVDAICVPRERAADLASQLVQDWEAYDVWPPAIDLALAEGWVSWDAERSEWEGPGRALLGPLPDLPVFGLWWD